MSVIWSGITEGGAIVPVQVDESGKVIATAEVREEYWAQNGNQLIPVNASNDIATYGKIVLGRASSGTSTLQSPPDAAGEVFTFPKTGGTLAIEKDTPTPTGISPFAFLTLVSGVVVNSLNIQQVKYGSDNQFQITYIESANSSNPSIVATSTTGYRCTYYTSTTNYFKLTVARDVHNNDFRTWRHLPRNRRLCRLAWIPSPRLWRTRSRLKGAFSSCS